MYNNLVENAYLFLIKSTLFVTKILQLHLTSDKIYYSQYF